MLEPVRLSVLTAQLEHIADEMDTIFERMAFSPVISDAWDRASGIYRPDDGSMIVQGPRGLPIFIGVMEYAVRALIETRREFRPGDVYLLNDPYSGGTHVMDVKAIRPVFFEGRLLCFVANTGHWPDLGGRVPGGFGTAATDIYQEGLRIPFLLICRDDRIEEQLVSLLVANSRVGADLTGDLDAQVTALRLGEARVRALVKDQGADTFAELARALISVAERDLRRSLHEIPDGVYNFVDELDNDGVDLSPIRLAVRVAIQNGTMSIDFSDSSPPVRGPMNSVISTTVSSCLIAVKHMFPDVMINSGSTRAIKVVAPTSTFLNATEPAPVAGCAAEVSQRIITAVLGALAGAHVAVPAGAFATVTNLAIGGQHLGQPFVMYCFLGGGYGGWHGGDGLTNGCSLMSNARMQSLEVTEARYPVRVRRFGIREESAGAGRWRGGYGVIYELEILAERVEASLLGDRAISAPRGVDGGGDGAGSEAWLEREGTRTPLKFLNKVEGLALRAGDVFCLRTPGGGGYGDPGGRDRAAVEADWRDGLLHAEELKIYRLSRPPQSAEAMNLRASCETDDATSGV